MGRPSIVMAIFNTKLLNSWIVGDFTRKSQMTSSVQTGTLKPWVSIAEANFSDVEGTGANESKFIASQVWNHGEFEGNHPPMAELFRLVNEFD